jgi:hypothetical protein
LPDSLEECALADSAGTGENQDRFLGEQVCNQTLDVAAEQLRGL